MKTNHIVRSMTWRRLLGAAVLLLVASPRPGLAQTGRFGSVLISVMVNPRSVPADNQTRARVRVELRDTHGNPVQDGTQVVLHTDLGYLSNTGADRSTTLNLTSQGGFASAWAISDTPGSALISINCVDSRTQANVDFLPPGQAGLVETHIVRIGGGWTAFASELNVVEARDKAWAKLGKVRLEGADYLQLDVDRMVLRGGPGKLTDGTHTLQADDFYVELESKRGVARRVGPNGVERFTFDLFTLTPRKMEWQPPEDAFRPQRASSITWIKAKEITVFSHEKIVFRHAALYTETSKIISLPPIWILALPGYTGASNTQVVGLNSVGGIAVRFPWFISAGSTTTDALVVEKGASASSVVARNDWSLGLSHEYRAGGTSGTLQAEGFPYSDWGARWQDSRLTSDGGESDLDLSSPDHQSLYLDHTYYNHEAGHSLDVRTFYQKPTGVTDAWGTTAEVLSDPQPIGRGHRLDFRLGGSLGVQKGGLGLVPADASRTLLMTGLNGYLDFAPVKLGPRTTLTPAVSNAFNWDTSHVDTNSLRGELRLDHSFGVPADVSLQMISQLSSGAFATTGWDNLIDLDARLYHGTTWMIFNSGSLDLTTKEWYDYATWEYYLNPTWRVELLGTWYNFAADSTGTTQQTLSDQEIFVGAKVYQDREIGLSWSRSTSRLSLELTGLTSTF